VLLRVAEVYQREVETARTLWQTKARLDRLIDSCERSQVTSYQAMLQVQVLLLTHLYIYALTYGDHMLIVEDQNVEKPSSNCNHCLIKLLFVERRSRLSYIGAFTGHH
jgi:hypothetical protein